MVGRCRCSFLRLAVIALIWASTVHAQPAPDTPTFNGSPIYFSVHGNPAAPPANILGSGVTPEMLEQGVYDPGDTLQMLAANRWTGQTNTAVFGLFDEGAHQQHTIAFKMRAGVGGLGGAVALLPTETFGDDGPITALPANFQWDEPNLEPASHGLVIAFDTHNPPTGNWFNAMGNLYDRPQREVSIHYNGVELANVLSPVDYPCPLVPEGDREGFVDVEVNVDYDIGGGYVTVVMDQTAVIDRLFVPQMRPRESRLAFGASSDTDFAGPFDLRALRYQVAKPVPADQPAPETELAVLADNAVLTADKQTQTFDVVLPQKEVGEIGRLLMNLKLDGAPGGIDPWSCRGAIYIYADDGERYEIVRFMTPFGRPYEWTFDVTDYALLLRGRRRVMLWVESRGTGQTPETTPGWAVTADLIYYPGKPERQVVAIQNLWTGEPEYGDPANPLENFFDPKTIQRPADAAGAELRLTVTGHGTHPTTYNAAEFMPADRTVIINNQHRLGNLLWDESAYLNPCRPQGGTWKFDRAGWTPGSIVQPWRIDLTNHFDPTGNARIHYVPMSYENLSRDQAKATHWVESQVIYYK
ncbi:MAG: peptide-N-glycosidase F-related protein [Planctomycetota bacterium]